MKKLLTLILICIGSVVSAQIPNYVPSNGLVGWWPFNGNANDESGNGNHGTVNGATLSNDRFSNVDASYEFTGTTNNITMINSFFENGWQNYSISFWINPSSNAINGCIMNTIPHDGIGISYSNYGTNKKLYHSKNSNTSVHAWDILNQDPFNYPSFEFGNWYHVLIVKIGNTYVYYVNGLLDKSINSSISPLNGMCNLVVGNIAPGYSPQPFNGNIDDIGIWNRALTACEIQDLYQAQLGYTTINAGLDQNVCTGNSVVLQGSGGNFLTWNNGVFDGVPFTPNQTSAYVLTGADTLGCVGVDTVVVTVLETSSSTMNETALDSYTWPLNGQTYTQSGTYTDTLVNAVGCDSVITLNLSMEHTGIGEFNQVQFYLIPNPNDGNFIIQSQNEALINSIQVTDLAGQILFESKGNQTEFQFGEMHSGTYFVIIQTDLGEQTIKYVKQ